MNRYVVANCGGRDVELHPGISDETLAALAASGFDFISVVGATFSAERGESQDQQFQLDRQTARRLFLASLAWALAVKEKQLVLFGRCWRSSFGVSEGFESGFDASDVARAPFPTTMDPEDLFLAVERSFEVLDFLSSSPPDPECLGVALRQLKSVLGFTWEVYSASARGRVEMSIC